MIRKLKKHKLDFDRTWTYVKDSLENVNVLSTELMNLLNFKTGNFFTLLPEDANVDKIYIFEWGGILPQNPIQEYYINEHKAYYSIKNSIEERLSLLLLKEIRSNPLLSYVMDEVNGPTPKDKSHPFYLDNYSKFYKEEIYFIVNKYNMAEEIVLKCLRLSNAIWHSLSVMTTADFNEKSKFLTLEKINEVCLLCELISIGAYNGEGYVFWEKNQSNFFDEKQS